MTDRTELEIEVIEELFGIVGPIRRVLDAKHPITKANAFQAIKMEEL